MKPFAGKKTFSMPDRVRGLAALPQHRHISQ
jgi:hypothetical protein